MRYPTDNHLSPTMSATAQCVEALTRRLEAQQARQHERLASEYAAEQVTSTLMIALVNRTPFEIMGKQLWTMFYGKTGYVTLDQVRSGKAQVIIGDAVSKIVIEADAEWFLDIAWHIGPLPGGVVLMDSVIWPGIEERTIEELAKGRASEVAVDPAQEVDEFEMEVPTDCHTDAAAPVMVEASVGGDLEEDDVVSQEVVGVVEEVLLASNVVEAFGRTVGAIRTARPVRIVDGVR